MTSPETKVKRWGLKMAPEVARAVEEAAKGEGTTPSDLIVRVLSRWAKEARADDVPFARDEDVIRIE